MGVHPLLPVSFHIHDISREDQRL